MAKAAIKSFECFTKKQHLANDSTQWEKKYPDGQKALVVVDDRYMTRALVRSAFKAQEDGYVIACFSRSDADELGYKC